jgi:hypothetical protein
VRLRDDFRREECGYTGSMAKRGAIDAALSLGSRI